MYRKFAITEGKLSKTRAILSYSNVGTHALLLENRNRVSSVARLHLSSRRLNDINCINIQGGPHRAIFIRLYVIIIIIIIIQPQLLQIIINALLYKHIRWSEYTVQIYARRQYYNTPIVIIVTIIIKCFFFFFLLNKHARDMNFPEEKHNVRIYRVYNTLFLQYVSLRNYTISKLSVCYIIRYCVDILLKSNGYVKPTRQFENINIFTIFENDFAVNTAFEIL